MANNNSKKYNIIKDRVELYRDFSINLLYYIYEYYIDYESLCTDTNINNHFSWCFNKVCDEFKLEGIDFNDNDELREYYRSYYYHQFYRAQDNPNLDTTFAYFENFWRNIFEVNEKQKNKNILNILVEIYKIQNASIKEEKNILEIV